MSINADVPMRDQRYQNGCPENGSTFPYMGQLPSNPPVNVFFPRTQKEFTEYVNRAIDPVVTLFFDSNNTEELRLLKDMTDCILGSKNRLVAVDRNVVPSVVETYAWPDKCTPIIARLFRTHILRYMDPPFTKNRLCLFFNTLKQWRGKGFFPASNTG